MDSIAPAWKEEDFENFWKHYKVVHCWINFSSGMVKQSSKDGYGVI